MTRCTAWALGLAGGVCLVLVASSLAADADTGPELPDARKGPPFPRIANCYGAGVRPDTDARTLDVLARFDLLIGGVNRPNWPAGAKRVAEHVAYLRKLNPHIRVLDFSASAPYVTTWAQKRADFPKDIFLLTPTGETINGWPGTLMINLTRQPALDFLAAGCKAAADDPSFDGTFIDCMGGQFDWWACEIATGKAVQVDADGDGKADSRLELDVLWDSAKAALGKTVRRQIGPKALFMANGADDSNFPYLNGILLEDYLDYVLDDGRSWDHTLRHYFHWLATPHRPTVTTIVSSSGLTPPFEAWKNATEEQRQALLDKGKARTNRMRFGLATTLMGDGYFAYDLSTRWRGQHWWYPEYDAPLGYPKGPSKRQPDGTWRRQYDGGLVVVNPTYFDVVVKTDGRCRDVSSGRVGERFVIPSQDGRILVPTPDAPAEGTMPDPSPLFTLDGDQPTVRRGGRVLMRLGAGSVAVFADDGRMLELYFHGRAVLRGARATMVSSPRWRDFEYADAAGPSVAGGAVAFAGRRQENDRRVAYRVQATAKDGSLTMAYEFTAETEVNLHAFRNQVEFPAALFAGGRVELADKKVALPGETPRRGGLLSGVKQMTVLSADGRLAVDVSSSTTFGLQDERVYNVDGFLLAQGAVNGRIAAGTKWRVDLTFTPRAVEP